VQIEFKGTKPAVAVRYSFDSKGRDRRLGIVSVEGRGVALLMSFLRIIPHILHQVYVPATKTGVYFCFKVFCIYRELIIHCGRLNLHFILKQFRFIRQDVCGDDLLHQYFPTRVSQNIVKVDARRNDTYKF
jgi:hypothetical protein